MQEKDIILKEYEENEVHFCAFVNGVLAAGKPLFKPQQAVSMPTEVLRVKDVSQRGKVVFRTIHRFRDLTKKLQVDDGYVVVAIQNQSKVDHSMPLRVMTEDALEYDAQRRMRKRGKLRKNEKLMGVITIVFYHGGGTWSGPKDMAEMVDLPGQLQELAGYIRSYPIIIVSPDAVDTSLFGDGWKEILEVLKRQDDEAQMRQYLEDNQKTYANLPEDTNRVIFALTGYLDYYKEAKKKGEEKVELCKAFRDHYQSGVREGRSEGRRQGRRQGRSEGIAAMIRDNLSQGVSAENIADKLQMYFSLNKQEAMRRIEQLAGRR